jgi:predicted NBD/HSP70 family sugar kinase
MAHKVLVVDVGGTHLKILASGQRTPRKIDSGLKMTPQLMCSWVRKEASGWDYDVASIGYPGPVVHGRPVHEPYNLAKGWVGFDYAKALGCPVKVINDAAMQALGSYQGGRMLFLGLGTGLGSAMIVDGILEPMELAHLPYKKEKTYEDYLGLRGLKRMGKKKWRHYVDLIVKELQAALNPDYIVLGGGNVKEVKTLPPKTRLGANGNAFIGGYRLWSDHRGAGRKEPG